MGNVFGWTWFANVNVAFFVIMAILFLIEIIFGIITEEIDSEEFGLCIFWGLAIIGILFIISQIFSWNFYTCFCIGMFILSILQDLIGD